jgi:hypothetical protein
MKKLVVAVAALGSMLAGCVAVEPVGYSTYGYGTTYYDNSYSSARGYRDRDGDGVPNRMDARPNNPYRY